MKRVILAPVLLGLVLEVPVYLAALFVRGDRMFAHTFLQAIGIVIVITLLVGLGALIWASLSFSPHTLPRWMNGWDVSDPVAFARAGRMHNFSFLGGLIGAVAGLAWVIRAIFASREDGAVNGGCLG